MTELASVHGSETGPARPEGGEHPLAIWGLTATELHAAWWRSHGVQVVYAGEYFEPAPEAEIFLLLPRDVLVIFSIEEITSTLVWSRSKFIPIVLYEKDEEAYREEIRRTDEGGVAGINRSYEFRDSNAVEAGFTTLIDEADAWAASEITMVEAKSDSLGGVARPRIEVLGHVFHNTRSNDESRFLRSLIAIWPDPSLVIKEISQPKPGVFLPDGEAICDDLILIPPVWLGAERGGDASIVVIGPEFVEDAAESQCAPAGIKEFADIVPQGGRSRKRLLPRRTYYGVGKRLFDIIFAALALTITAPILFGVAVIMILDDGFPIFFGHVRQSRGGRQFRCWKLRTMRRNAEDLVAKLADLNIADGPQVLIENDPRVTRVGRFLRKFQIDELPQFWNVLCGQMSVVGPRPSPDKENQFCPAWREMRLSVRPGITGLWQVSRTRTPGEDFQEWIRYDVEYVRTACFSGDLKIIAKTIGNLLRRD